MLEDQWVCKTGTISNITEGFQYLLIVRLELIFLFKLIQFPVYRLFLYNNFSQTILEGWMWKTQLNWLPLMMDLLLMMS